MIGKLLEIPNETLLDSLINISRESKTPNNVHPLSYQNSEALLERESERASMPRSSGAETPQPHSLSTPIRAKAFNERG